MKSFRARFFEISADRLRECHIKIPKLLYHYRWTFCDR